MQEELKNRIRLILKRYGINVNQLSLQIKRPQTTLNKQINGEAKVTIDTITAILSYYDEITADWLLMGKERKNILDPNELNYFTGLQPTNTLLNNNKEIRNSNIVSQTNINGDNINGTDFEKILFVLENRVAKLELKVMELELKVMELENKLWL